MSDSEFVPLPESVADQLVNTFLGNLWGKSNELFPDPQLERPPVVLGIIGIPGSGKTTVARHLAERTSALIVQSNSVRYLIRKYNTEHDSDYSWGENVSVVLHKVVSKLLALGEDIILDGGMLGNHHRDEMQKLVTANEASLKFLRIWIDLPVALQRQGVRYRDQSWVSSFDDFRVVSPDRTEEMLQNVRGRFEVDVRLRSVDVRNLVGKVNNNGDLPSLYDMVDRFV